MKRRLKQILKVNKQTPLKLAARLYRSSLLETMLLTTLILSRYYQNIDFSYPSDVVLPTLLFAVVSAVVYYPFRWILGRATPAHVSSLILAYLLYSFNQHTVLVSFTKAILPKNLETSFTTATVRTVLFIVICGAIGYAVRVVLQRKELRQLPLGKIIAFAVSFLFVTQVAKVGLKIVQIWPELTHGYNYSQPKQDKSQITGKPNIYYVVFDRYTNNEQLAKKFDVDNAPLSNFLESKGFVNRPGAYGNYPFTMSSITSTLDMNYHTDLGAKFGKDGYQTAFPYRAIFNNPGVAQTLKQNGYTYNQLSSWWDFTRVGIQADTSPTQSFRLRVFGITIFVSDLNRDIINKSILSPLLKKGVTVGNTALIKYDRDNNPHQNLDLQMNALETIASNKTDGPQFTFTHILVPHPPYVFGPDGGDTTYDHESNDNNVDETIKYKNSVTYINTRMREMVSDIRMNDPSAVVIIQSDEGPYPKEFRGSITPTHYYDPNKLPLADMQQKFGVLASYYMPGVPKETVAANITASVNPLRFVLSHYLGYDLPMLPNCQFSTGNKFKVYDYQLVTEKLTGKPAPASCGQYQ